MFYSIIFLTWDKNETRHCVCEDIAGCIICPSPGLVTFSALVSYQENEVRVPPRGWQVLKSTETWREPEAAFATSLAPFPGPCPDACPKTVALRKCPWQTCNPGVLWEAISCPSVPFFFLRLGEFCAFWLCVTWFVRKRFLPYLETVLTSLTYMKSA